MVSFILSTILPVTEIPLYSHFFFTKILEVQHLFIFIAFWGNTPRKMFFIDAEIVTLLRRPQDVIFEHSF